MSFELTEREQTVLRHLNEGMSNRGIMAAVRCNDRSLRNMATKLEALGLVNRPPLSERLVPKENVWPKERDERLKELVPLGWSNTQIGVELGVSRGAVAGRIDRLGLERPVAMANANRKSAARKNGERLVEMNKARTGKPRTDLKGSRKAKEGAEPVSVQPLAQASAHVPTDAELAASKSLLELGDFHCRFPILSEGSGMMDATRFCGCAKPYGKPYCEKHQRVCYTPAPLGAESLIRSLRRWAA